MPIVIAMNGTSHTNIHLTTTSAASGSPYKNSTSALFRTSYSVLYWVTLQLGDTSIRLVGLGLISINKLLWYEGFLLNSHPLSQE